MIACGLLARAVPIVASNLGALVAIVFIYVPVVVGRWRGEDLVDFGFHFAPIKRGLIIAFASVAILFPIFVFGFVVFFDVVCDPGAPAMLARLAPPGMCPRWDGWQSFELSLLNLDLAKTAFFQIVVVALPEELFFRGFIHKLLEERWKPSRRFLGGGIGLALVVQSALFAVVHTMVVFDPRRLSVFFPGLVFGWMRSATGSIFASVLFHTACNVFIDTVNKVFF